jgi:pimeloyl-ACP methyl ester carboxylesterase
LAVAGTQLHVRETGDGLPLLLINGIGAYMKMWTALEAGLPDVRLIAFDAPGSGRSPSPMVPLPVEMLAQLTDRLLDRLGYDCVDVLGYSFGGLIAQFLARQAPARVRRLVLVATMPGWGGVPAPSSGAAQMSWLVRSTWRQYEWMTQRLTGGGEGGLTDGLPWLSPPPVFGDLWHWLAMAASPGTLWWLRDLPQQTLVVTGDEDPLVPVANGLLLARHIPRARALIAPGEDHFLLMRPTSRAIPAIRSFLTAGDADRSHAWQSAVVVDDQMLADRLRAEGGGLIDPVAWMSAIIRKLVPVPRAQ